MEKILAPQAAKMLGISIDELDILRKQGLLHTTLTVDGSSLYFPEEIAKIKSRRGMTVAEEAAQIGIQIQQEVFSSVSSLVKLRNRIFIFSSGAVSIFLLLLMTITGLFYAYPEATSDFFGYYYKFNSPNQKISLSKEKGGDVLAASIGPDGELIQTTILADILRPAADTSLALIKVVDSQKYQEIATDPFLGTGQPGPPGSQGSSGADGTNGVDGPSGANGSDGEPGLTGLQGAVGSSGANGAAGSNGTNGTSGSNGANGTSVADILTTSGSIIIRNGTNTTVPLTAGSNGQVLTISGGIPAWENSSTTATNFTGSLSGDVTGTQGATVVGKLNGVVLGTTTATAGNLLIGSGTQWETQIISNDATIDSSGALTLKNVGTAGSYGSAALIPVITTDNQGRVSAVTAIAISGLTAANLTAGDFSSKITSGTYSINISGNAATATSATSATTTTNFSGSLSGDVTGTQGSTTVAKVNGNTLGLTTPTAGNLLIGNGSSWTTQTISNDATIDSAGVLTFKNVGTAGTYGTSTQIPVFTTDAQGRVSGVTNTTISNLTTSNLSSSAGITNSQLNSSAITINTTGPLSGGTVVSLGNSATLSCPTCLTTGGSLIIVAATTGSNSSIAQGGTLTLAAGSNITATNNGTGTVTLATSTTPSFTTINGLTITSNGANTLNIAAGKTLTVSNLLTFTGSDGTSFTFPGTSDDIVGRTVGQILTNKTITAASNTISGLTSTNLTAGDFSTVITSGTYGINISGSAATATNFTGSLSGDVTGTQGTTVVGKINSAVLGTTTATSGNLLIGSGTQWVTQAISSDATIDSAGALTLKNTGTASTYGSALSIPVFVTDAQGRVTSVANTTIAGLTNSNLSGSAGILNANLANSAISLLGNSGSGSVSLGGTLTLTGAGITNIISSGSTLTITSTEADTLASVTGRGATTATALTLNGGVITTTTTALTLDSGTTGGILIGTGANAKTITIGNATGVTAVNINSGTGNINFQAAGTGTTGRVQVGAGGAGSTTPDLLVLDVKSTAGDPTGINGAMYYNSNTAKFRCFENSAWTNCISAGSDIQSAATYDTTEALTNITSTQVTVTSVSVTPSTATGDVYIRAKAEILSSNGTDQSLVLSIEDNATCTGSTLATNTITITSGAGTAIGDFELSAVEVDAGTSSQSYSFCASTATGDSDIRLFEMFATVIDTGADLAEIYTTNDSSIEAGDVVSLDSSLLTGMKKSIKVYDQNVLGVVSTRPGVVIGSVGKEGIKALPIALSGRVPVKVSTLNGAINMGDYLTSSSIPGVAMKATEAGTIIGTAMAPFANEGVGQILVFVKNGSSIGNSLDGGDDIASNLAKPSKLENGIKKEILSYITEFISDLLKNTIDFFGNAIFHKNVTFLGRPTFNKDTAGHIVIRAGESEASLLFEKEYRSNPVVSASINLTEAVNPGEIPSFAIYDLSPRGFKVKLSKKATSDLNFSWIALAASGDSPIPVSPVTIEEQVTIVTESSPPGITSPSQQSTESATPTATPDPTPSPKDEASSSAQLYLQSEQ